MNALRTLLLETSTNTKQYIGELTCQTTREGDSGMWEDQGDGSGAARGRRPRAQCATLARGSMPGRGRRGHRGGARDKEYV